MKFNTEWCFSICKTFDNLACFSIPKLDNLVEARTEKLPPIVTKAYVPDGLAVPHVGPHAPPVRHDVPQLDGAVVTRREQ